jgi:hypothetical protein
VPDDDESSQKKVSDLTLSEVVDQLQILEYIETNTPQGLTDGDRRFQQELEEQEKLLADEQSREPKLEDLEKKLADRQAQESHDMALAQTAELNRFGPSQELTDRHRQEWEEQTKGFSKERDRYVEEFHASHRMLEELREREKQESLKRGDEREEDLGLSR